MADFTIIFNVVEKLGRLIIQEAEFLGKVRNNVEWVKTELQRMQCFLKDAESKWEKGDERVKNWVREIRDVAYEVEDIIDTIKSTAERQRLRTGFIGSMSRHAHIPAELITLHKVQGEIEQIKIKISDIKESRATYGIANLGEKEDDSNLPAPRRISHHSIDDKDFVGFKRDKKELIENLIDHNCTGQRVVVIVGMGGLGKTTLARRVYRDPAVKRHFHTFGWVAVSQNYQVPEILKNILKEVMGIRKENRKGKKRESEGSKDELENNNNATEITMEDLEKMGEEEVREKLKGFLEGKRYLVVLDDVWKTELWVQLQEVFPECQNGSRIMLTTRNMEVGGSAGPVSIPHPLKHLEDPESWDLLTRKAFPAIDDINKDSCPEELTDIGWKIMKKCGGLPLALVVMGSVLSKKDQTKIAWQKIYEKMDFESTKEGKEMFDILALSYNDLPHNYLKLCFLYVASFPEDSTISASKLIRLWIAEGLIPVVSKYTMEETARVCLEELVQRSMVQATKRSFISDHVKTISIHDLQREWCISKARKFGFLNVCSSHEDLRTPSDSIPSRRIVLENYSIDDELIDTSSNLHTLLAFNLRKKPSSGRTLNRLNSLRVIDLEGAEGFKKLPKEIGSMVHTRYLGLRKTEVNSLPSSVGYMCNLQTLDIQETLIQRLPNTLWKSQSLEHVYCDNDICPRRIENFKNLKTLSGIRAGRWLKKALQELSSAPPNMHKLSIYMKEMSDYQYMEAFTNLVGKLVHLNSLKLVLRCGVILREEEERLFSILSKHVHIQKLQLGISGSQFPRSHEFPPNLTKLVLCHYNLWEDPMPILEKLLSLVVLRLEYSWLSGEKMKCSAGGFPRLKHLTLYHLNNFEEWTVEAEAMPRLVLLSLIKLKHLRMIPHGLQRRPHLLVERIH